MSRSVTKARIILIQAERIRMIPGFSFMRPRVWRSFVTDLDTTKPISPKEPGAAEPRGRLDQRDRGCWDDEAYQDLRRSGRQRWSASIAPVPEDHRAPTCWHLGGRGGNVRVARGSQSPDLPSAPVLRPVPYQVSH